MPYHNLKGILYKCQFQDKERSEFLIEILGLNVLSKSLQKIVDGTSVPIQHGSSQICIRRLEMGIQIYHDPEKSQSSNNSILREIHTRALAYFKRKNMNPSFVYDRSLKLY